MEIEQSETPDSPDGTRVSRSVELDAPADDVWQMLVDDDERAGWIGGPTELEPVPGASGYAVDEGGDRRQILVEEVTPGERLRFHWWSTDHGASDVEIRLLPRGPRTLLTVIETRTGVATASAGPTSGLMARLVDLELMVLCGRYRTPALR